MASNDDFRKYSRQVGYMPQQWGFYPAFTALESVEYAAWLKGVSSNRLRSVATRALSFVGLLNERSKKVRQLSGGMQQRVGLAESIAHAPRILILDEPTVGLDPVERTRFRKYIQEGGGAESVLFSTHLTDDVQAIADRVLVVRGGSIVFDGTPGELANQAAGHVAGATALEAGYACVIERSAAVSTPRVT